MRLIRLAQNIKISAVPSLADICFLHVLYLVAYCIIQLGVSVTQYALIAFIYKLLSVSYSSFGSANATRYSTVLLSLCCGFYFHVVVCFPFLQCGDFGHLSSTYTKPADTSKSNTRRD